MVTGEVLAAVYLEERQCVDVQTVEAHPFAGSS